MTYQVNIKQIVTAIAVLAFVSCTTQKKMRIIPLSPYEQTVGYTEQVKTREFTFAIENFRYTKANMQILDSFVLKRLPKENLKEGQSVLFLFYKYEKGKIDENFVHREQPKQFNLFMEADAKSLVDYHWLHGKFVSVSIYENGRYKKMEDRNW